MYTGLLIILGVSIVILFIEAAYVTCHMRSKIHASLLLYILCCLVNNVGYLMEMTAQSSAAAYTATKLLYLGKINIAFALLLFILQYCKVKTPKALRLSLFAFHQILYGIILTNDWHHLYYSSIRFDTEGIFPHNDYGHGPVYYVAMVIPYVYLAFCLVTLIRTFRKLKTKEERNQLVFLLVAPSMSMLGTLIFFTGKTGGFDTGNIGLMFSALILLIPLFRYQLIDTVDMVRNTLTDSLQDGLIAVDAYGELSYHNEIADKLIPTLTVEQNKKLLPEIVNNLEHNAETKERLHFYDRYYVVRIQNLYQGKFYRGRLYILADITEDVSYTRQIEAERDRADRANSAKGQFLANMSHEIRTPINAVLGMDAMILRKSKEENTLKYARDIQSAGKNLLSIINDILDFSKIDSGKMEIIPCDYDFADMLGDISNMIGTKAREKDLAFVMDIDETIPCGFFGDDVRIRQILVNLLTNAVKYTKTGTVTLRIRRNGDVQQEQGKAASLHFAVIDTGIGIKEEDLGKLTEKFVRIEESRNRNIEGTGLGINIVVSLLNMMGSKLEVDSVYGKGSTFGFELLQPVTNPEKIGDFTERLNSRTATGEEYLPDFVIPDARILVVDDNAMNLKVFCGLIEDMQCHIDAASSGFACLELVKENRYDLIFLDHMMPEMDGVETLRRMREFGAYPNANTPVVALTANAISGAKEKYLEAGFTDYLSKPIDADRLVEMIEKLIPGEKKKSAGSVVDKSETVLHTVLETTEDRTEGIPETPKVDFPFIDGVNWELAMENLGDEELLLDLVKDFAQTSPEDYRILEGMFDALKASSEKADFDAFRIKVHSMKSNAATLGAIHVAGLAKYLEYAAKEYRLERICQLMPAFCDEWGRLKSDMDSVFHLTG